MKLLFKILVCVILIVSSLIGLDKLFSFGISHNKNTKAEYVQSKKIDAEILFHGPCEPLWMIDPEQIDPITKLKSYNLALSHSDFADNYLHLYLYLKNNKAPKYLFLYVTPESLDKKFNTFNTYRFSNYTGDSLVKEVVVENDPDYARWTSIPYMRFAYYNSYTMFNAIQGCKHYYSDKAEAYYPSGFEPPAKIVWDNHLEDMQHQYPKGYTFSVDPLRIKYLGKTIELAQQKGTKVILYESPVLKESLNNLKNRAEMIEQIKLIAKDYNIKYVQFDNLPLAESRDYFISSLNLNLKGIKIFNDTLAGYMKRKVINK
ncbi:MAG: hypothetical protein Q8M29_08270 [Bacteroidota bacterium]|nr:hypothetical protein [Bacteroidota bacterium]